MSDRKEGRAKRGDERGRVGASDLGDDGLEVVGLEPVSQRSHVGGVALDAVDLATAEVAVEVLVDLDGGVLERVDNLVHEVAGRLASLRLGPRVTSRVS